MTNNANRTVILTLQLTGDDAGHVEFIATSTRGATVESLEGGNSAALAR